VKLLFTVLYLDQNKMEVTIQDRKGHRRRILYTWLEKESSGVPLGWIESVEGEVEYRLAEELAEETGRKLPF